MTDQAQAASSGVRIPPPLVYAAGLVVGVAVNHFVPMPFLSGAVRWWLGGALVLCWVIVWAGALPLFARAKTPLNPTKPVRALITTGMFRFSRNPVYLGWALVYLGISALANSLLALALFIPVQAIISIAIVPKEESYLERRFGDEYLEYKRRVRRWL